MAAPGGDHEQCWICLDDASEDGNRQLMSPCKCPRQVHPQCLARWQLQQAGRHEEKFCRFCNSSLEDWKTNLTPKNLAPEISKVQPVMVVYFEGQIHRIPVKQGPEGLAEFQTKIRTLFRLPEDVDISLTFGCKEPMSGQHLKLEGVGAFDAAVHCASVAAADRQQRVKRSQSAGDLAGGGGAPRGARGSGAAATTAAAAGTPAAPAAPATPAAVGRSSSNTLAAAAARAASRVGGGRSRSFNMPPRGPLFAAPQLQLPPALPEASPAAGGGSPPPAAPVTPLQLAARASSATAPGSFRSAFAAAAGRAGSPSPPPPPQPASPGGSSSAVGGEEEEEAAASAAAAAAGAAAQGAPKHGPEAPPLGRADAGSLGGRLKVSLKALSRKVARSLSFSSGSSRSSGSLGAADGPAPSGLARAASAAAPPAAAAAPAAARA